MVEEKICCIISGICAESIATNALPPGNAFCKLKNKLNFYLPFYNINKKFKKN
jgi:hypothetical protein